MLGNRRSGFAAVALVVVAITAAACSNASQNGGGGGSSAPGITSNQIVVGSLGTLSGPLSSDFAAAVPGAKAYFSMVNAKGGVNGRKIVLKYTEDDASNPSQDTALARTLVDQDHVFAVLPVATPFFAASTYLAQQGTPTFGYVVSKGEWSPAPNLFGAYGSYLSYTAGAAFGAYLAKQVHTTSVGVLAYSAKIAAVSAGACAGEIKQFQAAHIHVGYSDLATGLEGSTVSADVLRMKQAGVDFVLSCMDVNGNIALSRAMHQNGLGSAKQLWLNGYDRNVLQQYPSLMNGVYLLVQHVPFEAAAKYPGTYPGLETYLSTMQKYQPQYIYNEVAMEGWLNAALFVSGLKAVGPNLTQGKLVAAINKMKDFSAGVTQPIDWTYAHTRVGPDSCNAFVQAGTSDFHIVLNKGKNVWVCLSNSTGKVVPLPAGTPGA